MLILVQDEEHHIGKVQILMRIIAVLAVLHELYMGFLLEGHLHLVEHLISQLRILDLFIVLLL